MGIIASISDMFRPVLSDKTIMKYNKKGLLITTPIPERQIQPNSVDITLGNTWKKLYSDKYGGVFGIQNTVDPMTQIEYEKGLFTKVEKGFTSNGGIRVPEGTEYYVLKPNEFILMASNEILNIPNGILCFVQGRSSIARMGIQTEQAGLVDAGFIGTITFEIYNQTKHNIVLYKGMRVAQLYFFKSQHAFRPYGSIGKGSKYQTQIEATGSRIHMDFR